MATCPTCGQLLSARDEAERLLGLLTNATPHREVYRGRDGAWYLTYGGGPFTERAVKALVEIGAIQSVYSSIPGETYHVGRTWDCERTLEARKRLGKKAPDYFVGDP